MRRVNFICPPDVYAGPLGPMSTRVHEAEDDQRIIFQKAPRFEQREPARAALHALAKKYPDCFVCILPFGWRIEVAGEPQPEEYKEGVSVPATLPG